jgi:integrase
MAFLTDARVRAARPQEKAYKLCDSLGLYLKVETSGGRLWRFKYHYAGVEKLLSLGRYPEVSLKRARDKRDEARRLLTDGVDPAIKRKTEKLARGDTFGAIALEWLEMQRKRFAPATYVKAEWTFTDLIIPYIGRRPTGEITAPELLALCRRLEARGKNETAHRTLQRCGQVFRYALATGRALRDPTGDLRGALAPIVSRNRAAITDPTQIAQLMRVIWDYRGHPSTEAAFKLSALLFVRPGELRKAEWHEFDLERAEWRIPAHRMKMREQHVVPLASQAVDILRTLQPVTNRGRYVFACLRGGDRPMSEAAITAALRRMGYTGDQMSWHGFRTIASTCLNEQGFDPDLIELQLAHAERNRVRAAYNKAQRVADRCKMMQAWADYLDGLRGLSPSPTCSDSLRLHPRYPREAVDLNWGGHETGLPVRLIVATINVDYFQPGQAREDLGRARAGFPPRKRGLCGRAPDPDRRSPGLR